MTTPLTNGALLTICQGGTVDRPVLQLLGVKKIAGSACDRYRLLVSDGHYSNSFAMLATHLNTMVYNSELTDLSIVCVLRYICNSMQGKKIIIILDMEVLHLGCQVRERLGDPIVIEGDGTVNQELANIANNNLDVVNILKRKAGETSQTASSRAEGVSPFKKPLATAPQGRQANPGHQYFPISSPQMTSSQTGNEQPSVYVLVPICALNPFQNRWTIKGRVIRKSDIRPWGHDNGRLFSVDLIDESGEIRATGFNELCDKFFNVLDVGKVYAFTNCIIKSSDLRYTGLQNDYEMSFINSTQILPYTFDTSNIPSIRYQFRRISDLSPALKDQTVDILGICISWSEVTILASQKTNKDVKKRVINIVDQSRSEVSLTIWGAIAEAFNPDEDHPVLAAKGVKVSDYNGVTLSAWSSSVIQINPDLPETEELKAWYMEEEESHWTSLTQVGSRGGVTSAGDFGLNANMKTVMDLYNEKLGTNPSNRPDYYSMMATVSLIRAENALYMGCANETDGKQCNKKVIDLNNGLYRCEKCQQDSPRFNWRLILSINLMDATGNLWATCFQDEGEKILGSSSEELGHLQATDKAEFTEHVQSCIYKRYNFRMRCKTETYNGQTRVKHFVLGLAEVQMESLISRLIAELDLAGVNLPGKYQHY